MTAVWRRPDQEPGLCTREVIPAAAAECEDQTQDVEVQNIV